MDQGLYIAVFGLFEPQMITVGKLGCFSFPAGYYFYVGSAQKNLNARLERHQRKQKTLRWHIDYLSSHATMLGAVTIAGDRSRECQIAQSLSGIYDVSIARFGASDCRCPTHLFYAKRL